ncbi:MAG TPA: hypothetical protein VIJ70_07015 [Gaiellaceae bacterium]
MNLGKLTSQAKKLIDKRGGIDGVKGDARELKNIARGSGSLEDKAKAAAAALKEPGAHGVPKHGVPETAAPETAAPEASRTETPPSP